MKYILYILLLASVSLLGVPYAFAVSPTLSAGEINPKVRAYEAASSSGESAGNAAGKPEKAGFPVKTLKKLTDRLHASVFRIESINSRIAGRAKKMQKSGVKVTKINTRLSAFVKQLNLLKNEMETIDKLTLSLPDTEARMKEYTAFRSEVTVLRGILNDSLVAQKAIIADMKVLEPGITPIVSKTVIKE